MRSVTFFAIFTVALATVVMALPSPSTSQTEFHQLSRHAILHRVFHPDVRRSLDLSKYSTRDFTADKILAVLGVSAGDFLKSIDNNLKEVAVLINGGVSELQSLMQRLSPAARQQIEDIINQALADALANIRPILQDLGIVLPSITRTSVGVKATIGDVIWAILGISLEEFLNKIVDVLELSDALLTRTRGELLAVASTVVDSVLANQLRAIAETHLTNGRNFIRPILTNLYKVLEYRAPPVRNVQGNGGDRGAGILAKAFSQAIGFDLVNTSHTLEDTLEKVAETTKEFVQAANAVLFLTPSVRAQVNDILSQGLREAEATMKPVLDVLLYFSLSPNNSQKRGFTEITSTLLGVGLEDFLTYVDFAVTRVEEIYSSCLNNVRNALSPLNPSLEFAMGALLDQTNVKLTRDVSNFISTILPILGERKWISVEEFVEIHTDGKPRCSVFCDFSLLTGNNLDLVLYLISHEFRFDVVNAADELARGIHDVDSLYVSAAKQLLDLIKDEHPFVVTEVRRVLNHSVAMSHHVLQPVIDVLIEFIPTSGRHDKDVMHGIVRSVGTLDLDTFRSYLLFTMERLEDIAQTTFNHIHHLVRDGKKSLGNGNGSPVREVDELMTNVLSQTKETVAKFGAVVAPIFEA